MQQYNYRSCITTLCYCTRRGLLYEAAAAAVPPPRQQGTNSEGVSTVLVHVHYIQRYFSSANQEINISTEKCTIYIFRHLLSLSQFKKINRDLKLQSCYLVHSTHYVKSSIFSQKVDFHNSLV